MELFLQAGLNEATGTVCSPTLATALSHQNPKAWKLEFLDPVRTGAVAFFPSRLWTFS